MGTFRATIRVRYMDELHVTWCVGNTFAHLIIRRNFFNKHLFPQNKHTKDINIGLEVRHLDPSCHIRLARNHGRETKGETEQKEEEKIKANLGRTHVHILRQSQHRHPWV